MRRVRPGAHGIILLKVSFHLFGNSFGTKKKVSGNVRCIVLEQNAGPLKMTHLLGTCGG